MSPRVNPLRGLQSGDAILETVGGVELIKPLPESVFIKLLFSKPVSDWEKMTTFLVNRKLISFFVVENLQLADMPTDSVRTKGRMSDRLKEEEKEIRKKAHDARVKAQADAASAKKARIAAGHLKRVSDQQAAAAARKANRAKQEAERVAAAAKRKARAVAATKVTELKRAADVKVWLEGSLDTQIAKSKDLHSTRLALQTLPPVLFSKQDVRPIRPLVKLQKANGVEQEVEISDVQNFDLLQEIIRSADRHLSYLFHEADTDGWKLVSRQRAVGRKSVRTGRANSGASAV